MRQATPGFFGHFRRREGPGNKTEEMSLKIKSSNIEYFPMKYIILTKSDKFYHELC